MLNIIQDYIISYCFYSLFHVKYINNFVYLKVMRKFLLSIFALALLVTPMVVFAQEEELMLTTTLDDTEQTEEELISPESPFYFLSTLFEDIQLLLTFDTEKKIEKTLEFAQKKLDAMENLDKNEDSKIMEKLEYRFEKLLTKTERKMEQNEYTQEESALKTQEIRDRHLAVLNSVLEKVPEGQAQESIQKVIDKTEERYIKKDEKIKSNNKGGNKNNVEDDTLIEE